MDETTPLLLTVPEVAALLRVDQSTVRRWIKEGTLCAVPLPHRGKRTAHRILRNTLNNLLSPAPLQFN